MSAAALGVAAMLVIFVEETSQWFAASSTASLDHQGSQLVVAQSGIDDLLFAQSTFPQDTMARVGHIPGGAAAYPVVGVNGGDFRGRHVAAGVPGRLQPRSG